MPLGWTPCLFQPEFPLLENRDKDPEAPQKITGGTANSLGELIHLIPYGTATSLVHVRDLISQGQGSCPWGPTGSGMNLLTRQMWDIAFKV